MVCVHAITCLSKLKLKVLLIVLSLLKTSVLYKYHPCLFLFQY